MRAGDLDRLITIFRNQPGAVDEFNAAQENWRPYATVHAKWQQISGREFFAAQEIMTERRAIFVIRYREDLLMTDRIQFGGDIWLLAEIRELGRRDGLELQAYVKR